MERAFAAFAAERNFTGNARRFPAGDHATLAAGEGSYLFLVRAALCHRSPRGAGLMR